MTEQNLPRVKFTEVRTIEFDLNPEHYDDGWTLEQMLEQEVHQAEAYVEFWDCADTESLTYRVLSGGDSETPDSKRLIDRGGVTKLSPDFQSDLLDFVRATASLVEEHGTPELRAQLERITFGGEV